MDHRGRQEPSRIAKEVGQAMTSFGLPWLNAMSKFDVARRAVEECSQVSALGFDRASGDLARARQRFRELLESGTDLSALRAWGRTKGLGE